MGEKPPDQNDPPARNKFREPLPPPRTNEAAIGAKRDVAERGAFEKLHDASFGPADLVKQSTELFARSRTDAVLAFTGFKAEDIVKNLPSDVVKKLAEGKKFAEARAANPELRLNGEDSASLASYRAYHDKIITDSLRQGFFTPALIDQKVLIDELNTAISHRYEQESKSVVQKVDEYKVTGTSATRSAGSSEAPQTPHSPPDPSVSSATRPGERAIQQAVSPPDKSHTRIVAGESSKAGDQSSQKSLSERKTRTAHDDSVTDRKEKDTEPLRSVTLTQGGRNTKASDTEARNRDTQAGEVSGRPIKELAPTAESSRLLNEAGKTGKIKAETSLATKKELAGLTCDKLERASETGQNVCRDRLEPGKYIRIIESLGSLNRSRTESPYMVRAMPVGFMGHENGDRLYLAVRSSVATTIDKQGSVETLSNFRLFGKIPQISAGTDRAILAILSAAGLTHAPTNQGALQQENVRLRAHDHLMPPPYTHQHDDNQHQITTSRTILHQIQQRFQQQVQLPQQMQRQIRQITQEQPEQSIHVHGLPPSARISDPQARLSYKGSSRPATSTELVAERLKSTKISARVDVANPRATEKALDPGKPTPRGTFRIDGRNVALPIYPGLKGVSSENAATNARRNISSGNVDERYTFGTEIALVALLASGGISRRKVDQAGMTNPSESGSPKQDKRNGAELVKPHTDEKSGQLADALKKQLEELVRRLSVQPVSVYALPQGNLPNSNNWGEVKGQQKQFFFGRYADNNEESELSQKPSLVVDGRNSHAAESLDEHSDNQTVTRLILQRPSVLVSMQDTLDGIAETIFHDPNVGWLIASINKDQTGQREIDGRLVVTLSSRQKLTLPLFNPDIVNFYSQRREERPLDQLVTIVEETEIDRELMSSVLGGVVGENRKVVQKEKKQFDTKNSKLNIPSQLSFED
jgi:hypothetical protein